ncbi:unnamed protein product [Orchesella dallaii]|uniref:Uncharacterized protein n=1 Tax=Orchesella dallaii TaxID=48710 RepID=A0ABP1S111_9HEXA
MVVTLTKNYVSLRNEVNCKIVRAKNEYFSEKFQSVSSSTDLWRVMDELINFRLKATTKIIKLVDNEGAVLDTDDTICLQLANDFRVNNLLISSSISEVNLDNYE